MKIVTAGEILEIKTGKYDANHAKPDGKYRFFTCAMESTMADTYAFDDEVLILPGNGANVGEVFYYKGKLEAYQRTYILHKITQNTRYLYYYFKKNWIRQITKRQVGSATNYIKMDDIVSFEIPLPPLPQQQKIANILDAADALRQNDKALIAKYDELTQALFLDMFGDPVSNPKGWEKVELGNITDLITDGKHGNCNDEPNSGYYFISAKDIFDDNINYNRVREIPKSEFEEVDRRTNLQAGDLVMVNTGATIGKLAIAKDIPETRRTTFQKSVAVIKVKREKIDTVFLKYVFILRLESFSGKGSGSAIQNLLLSEMRRFKIIIPPLELQNQFAERVAVIEEQKAIAQKSLEHSESLFNSLLQKAFKGELA